MTAYPEKVKVESMFGSIAIQPAEPPQATTAARSDSRRWRVVAADGSTKVLEGAASTSAEAAPQAQQPAQRPERVLHAMEQADAKAALRVDPSRRAAAALEAINGGPGAASKATVAMPSVTPKLAESVEPVTLAGRPTLREARQRCPEASLLGRGDALVVEPGRVGRPCIPEPASPEPKRPPVRSIAAPQSSPRCRDIDSQLARIIDTWPILPRSVRAAMLAMIEAVRQER